MFAKGDIGLKFILQHATIIFRCMTFKEGFMLERCLNVLFKMT